MPVESRQEGPRWPGGGLNFQLNETIVVSPGGSISPSGTKTSRLVDPKIVGMGSKHFAVGHYSVK